MHTVHKTVSFLIRVLTVTAGSRHSAHKHWFAAKILLLMIVVLACSPVSSARAAVNLAIDGSRQFQAIDGFGVNANSLSWKNGELKPAIDLLVDEMGANIWRVVIDETDWESANDNADPNVFDWNYYNGIYSDAKFQNLWGTIGYLNQKGISSGIMLSLMGVVPDWMGGDRIIADDEWVEMVASLVYYARNVMHLSFSMIDPLNETDVGTQEGPRVDPGQYTDLLGRLAVKLDSMGLGDMRLVGPGTAEVINGSDVYMPAMMNDSAVMAKIDHFGLHSYYGATGDAYQKIRNSPYPDRNLYITEMSAVETLLSLVAQGASAILVWEGYDSVYNHAIAKGLGSTPPNDAGNGPAPLAYSTVTRSYTPRKVFYQFEQLFKFVPPGSVRIFVSDSGGSGVLGFYHQQSGRLTLVGRNSGTGPVSYTGAIANLPAMGTLQFYRTSESDTSVNFARGDDVAVNSGAFSFDAPAGSMFTLTGIVEGADSTPPTVSITAPVNGASVSNTVQLTASASDNVGVGGLRFQLDGVNLNGDILSPPYTLSWNTGALANGTYTLSAVARDTSGNTVTSAPVTIIVENPDTAPPAASVTSPLQNAVVSGTIAMIAAASDTNGVAGVRFLIDGVPFGMEITVAPYSLPLNTLPLVDGIHTVAVLARDAFGNSITSPAIIFRVLNNSGTILPINFIQKASNITSSAQNLSVTLPSPITAGDLIVVSVSGWPNLPAATPVTDNLGNSYNIAGTVLVSQGAYSAIYYARNVTAGTADITFRTVNTGGQISMTAAEFSGADMEEPLDKATGTVGSGYAPSSGTMTPGMTGELIIGSGTHNGSTVTVAGSGFSMIAIPTEDSVTHQPLAMEFRVLGSEIAPVSATFSLANGYPWTQNGALFRPRVLQGADATPPAAAMTAPLAGATLSGAVAVSATATDNIGVTRVEFYLDGLLQDSDSAAPYQWSWNSLSAANGSHTLTARAYDAAGNTGTSPGVIVTVANLPSGILLVQKAANITSNAQNLSVTLPSPVTAGDLVVVSVSGWPNLPAATPVTDTLGNSYSIAGTVLISQGAYSAIYFARSVAGGTATITFRTVRSNGQISMVAAEFSGIDINSPLDKSAGRVGKGRTPSSGSMTPDMPGSLVIGSGTHNGNTVTTAGPGFTMIAVATEDSGTHQPLAMEYRVMPSAEPASAVFGLATGYHWTMNGALFKGR